MAHRLALDHPNSVLSLILLDIAPTLDMYELTDSTFSTYYYHWFFLIQPYPFPEDLLSKNPQAYMDKQVGRLIGAKKEVEKDSKAQFEGPLHPPELIQHYSSNFDSVLSIHSLCEDYRASSPIDGPDTILDRSDRDDPEVRIQCPTRQLWGKKGLIQLAYDGGLDLWRKWMKNPAQLQGKALEGGHYLPEECPKDVVDAIVELLSLTSLSSSTSRA